MKRIGIKFSDTLAYEAFESFQYLLDYDFEYEDLEESVAEQKVIELDIDDEEDRAEDIEVLTELLKAFDAQNIEYKLYVFESEWRVEALENLK